MLALSRGERRGGCKYLGEQECAWEAVALQRIREVCFPHAASLGAQETQPKLLAPAWCCSGAAPLPPLLKSLLLLFFYVFFPVHISTPSCLLPMKPKFLVWMETRGKRAVAPHGARAGGDICHGAFGARGCSKTLTRGVWRARGSPSAWG